MYDSSTLLMIRPANFSFNVQTSSSNSFQRAAGRMTLQELQRRVEEEFTQYVRTLEQQGIGVIVYDDTPEPAKPDAVFPNNWISFHEDGTVVLYPMEAENRRLERRDDILRSLQADHGFVINRVLDLTEWEREGHFLEGTGSIVFDYRNKIAYASESSRTHPRVLEMLASELGFENYLFQANDRCGKAIYHTNVHLVIGDQYVIMCSEAIGDPHQADELQRSFRQTGRKIIDISLSQVEQFSGNALEVQRPDSSRVLIVSESGANALTEPQKELISRSAEIVPVSIPLIEQIGGGSARCMIADIRLPRA